MRLELDITNMKNEVVIIGDGKAKVTHLPGFSETKIVTHQGKVLTINIMYIFLRGIVGAVIINTSSP
jgi:hypothetical protein